jgi:diaminopimelate decarboxylase
MFGDTKLTNRATPIGFEASRKGVLVDGRPLGDFIQNIDGTPAFIYSAARIAANIAAYQCELPARDHIVSYSAKANSNLEILRIARAASTWCTLVSGGELLLALEAGFDRARLILNGNGKTEQDVSLAVQHGVMTNVDAAFDVDRLSRLAHSAGKTIATLIRVNPDVDPNVHPHVSTGLQGSKFGIALEDVSAIADLINAAPGIELVGLHCHLGSTIRDVSVMRAALQSVRPVFEALKGNRHALRYLNIGGGLDIDYAGDGSAPSVADLGGVLRDETPRDVTVIVEPGRSIVGDAGVLLTSVIGVKRAPKKTFVVVDASMTELLRPSLYGAFHRVVPANAGAGKDAIVDVVGPVCESGDYIARERTLPLPEAGDHLVVMDAGAYGFAMSSNYNVRPRAAEYLVRDGSIHCIRLRETIDDILRPFPTR